MSDSKVFMLPENGYNNGSLGLGGWGGGIMVFSEAMVLAAVTALALLTLET